MNQLNLSKWLKAIILGTACCGAIIYFYIFPYYGQSVALDNPEFSFCYWPWLCFIWITAIPCYAVLYFSWCISSEIGKDNSFSERNALLLKRISHLAIIDSAIFFVGNVVYLLIGMNHPGIVLFSLIVVFIGIAVAVASAALSHLVLKAAEIRRENELTI